MRVGNVQFIKYHVYAPVSPSANLSAGYWISPANNGDSVKLLSLSRYADNSWDVWHDNRQQPQIYLTFQLL